MSGKTSDGHSDEVPAMSEEEAPSARKSRRKQTKRYQDSDSDSDDFMPAPKRAKPGSKKEIVHAAKRSSKPPIQAKSSSVPASSPPSTAPVPQQLVPLPYTSGEAIAMPRPNSSGDSLAQYQGIPLEELRLILSPQEYIKVSILRSMAESPHGGKDKNVPKFLHPHLTASALSSNLNWDLELRSMIATWVDMPVVSTSVLSILEAEATRYTASVLKDLMDVVQEHLDTGLVNGRPQKPMMFSNQAQRIDMKAISVVSPPPSLTAEHPSSVDTAPPEASASNTEKISKKSVEEEEHDEDEDDEEYATSQTHKDRTSASADESGPEEDTPSTVNAGASIRGTTKAGFARIPIGTLDHLAEALLKRHPSLVRRLEHIMKRLAEDDEAQQVNKDTQAEGVSADTLQEDDYDPAFTPDDVWMASPDLEDYLERVAPVETRERQQELRDILMAERMIRVEKIPVAKLDDWQNASSVSFARPRRLIKYKSWLVQCCHWDQHGLCIPPTLATAINFLMYEHLRYIVRASLMPSQKSLGAAPVATLRPEKLRAEIEVRILAGDCVQVGVLATDPKESTPT